MARAVLVHRGTWYGEEEEEDIKAASEYFGLASWENVAGEVAREPD
jgi:hypothetical protein